jgi:hypothetical protein
MVRACMEYRGRCNGDFEPHLMFRRKFSSGTGSAFVLKLKNGWELLIHFSSQV